MGGSDVDGVSCTLGTNGELLFVLLFVLFNINSGLFSTVLFALLTISFNSRISSVLLFLLLLITLMQCRNASMILSAGLMVGLVICLCCNSDVSEKRSLLVDLIWNLSVR